MPIKATAGWHLLFQSSRPAAIRSQAARLQLRQHLGLASRRSDYLRTDRPPAQSRREGTNVNCCLQRRQSQRAARLLRGAKPKRGVPVRTTSTAPLEDAAHAARTVGPAAVRRSAPSKDVTPKMVEDCRKKTGQ